MPNKSDSAGKLHQYFTCVELKKRHPASTMTSPLSSDSTRHTHVTLFNSVEIGSLQKIGKISANAINTHIGVDISKINDIGTTSGTSTHNNTDDIEVILSDSTTVAYSLKCSKTFPKLVLSKNMGAKSLLKKYFNSIELQLRFNEELDRSFLTFLNSNLENPKSSISTARKAINDIATQNELDKARFGDPIFPNANHARDIFLRTLRVALVDALTSTDDSNLADACNLIIDVNKHHILAGYAQNKEAAKLVSNPEVTEDNDFEIDIRGNDSVVISVNDYEVGFRYKFESGITGSIKLVGDYKKITK